VNKAFAHCERIGSNLWIMDKPAQHPAEISELGFDLQQSMDSSFVGTTKASLIAELNC